MKKALIAMSGGVDSSVAAYLTMQAGYECIGCTMRLYDNEDAGLAAEKTCCSLDDTEDARAVANRLGIPFYVFNFTDLFREKVIGNFVSCYLCGKTPNPCIECNRYLKFEKLLERAEALGCDKVVTGHYAQIVETDAGYQLRRGADHSKDQSYVLYMLTQAQLSHIMLPLGGMTKTEVRAIAEAQGFVTAHKRDSQDICFVPDGDYARIVEQQSGITPEGGDFVDLQGNVLGRHRGLIHYTVGQRRGLGIAVGKPAYVCGLDVPNNRVIIGENKDLFEDTCTLEQVSWTAGDPPQTPVRCLAKIRYRHPAQPATLTFTGADTAILQFDEPQRAITAGQAAVCYDGDTVLGGGTICGTGSVQVQTE